MLDVDWFAVQVTLMHLGLKLHTLCAPLIVLPSTPEVLHATQASETSVSKGRNRARND
jgi:hypothetical protein